MHGKATIGTRPSGQVVSEYGGHKGRFHCIIIISKVVASVPKFRLPLPLGFDC